MTEYKLKKGEGRKTLRKMGLLPASRPVMQFEKIDKYLAEELLGAGSKADTGSTYYLFEEEEVSSWALYLCAHYKGDDRKTFVDRFDPPAVEAARAAASNRRDASEAAEAERRAVRIVPPTPQSADEFDDYDDEA